MILGFRASQAIHVAATLGLADLLRTETRTSEALAAATGTHPASLYRLMRSLASMGLFHEDEERRFTLTAAGRLLRSDVAGSLAPMARLIGRPNFWQAWGDLLHAVRTGATAFDHVHGCGVWDYRANHSEEAGIFDRAMASITEQAAEAVLAACDFSRFHRLVDVGGGDGMLLARILAAHQHLCATLFDQPHVIARASAALESAALSDRCLALGGDFFVEVPEGGDAYLLKWILHDWDDAASVDILRSCRMAMTPAARLLIIEHVIDEPNKSPAGTLMDLNMMVMTGGRERTGAEFAALLAAADFETVSVTPTASTLSILEAAPI
ncbi:acetylserotonin O-methyltransferase [Bosea sp. LjRoot237]